MTKRNLTLVIAIIILIFALGYYFYNTSNTTDKPVTSNTQKAQTRIAKNSGWKVYTNTKYGYEFEYPENATVEISNPDTNYEFSSIKGPVLDVPGNNGRNYPWITIQHYPDAEFFNPPSSAIIENWVLNNQKFPQEGYDKVQKNLTIAGEPAVDLISNGSAQADPTDDYYLIHKGKLYQIQLLHVSNTKDQQLYTTFLQSFKFID